MRRTLARSRAFLFVIVLAGLLSPALVATSAEAAPAKYRVSIRLSDTNVAVGEKVLVTGKVRPVANGKVLLQRRTGGRWSTLRKVNLVGSTYATNIKLTRPGVTFLRTVVPASKRTKQGRSKVRTVRVVTNATNPQIATAALPAGVVGTPYSAQVSTADNRPGAWTITPGALPPGLSIDPATGLISGTPTTEGTSDFGVYFRDSDGRVAAKMFQVAVTVAVIATDTLPGGFVGTAYTAQLKSVGNVAGTWSVTTGTLPAGLTLNPTTGEITGTPTTVGTSAFTIQFKDAAGKTATKQFSIEVKNAPPVISTTTLPKGKVNTAYTATLTTADKRAGVWTIDTGALPAGLTLNATTGAISGTPTAKGTSTFTVKFTDATGATVTKPLSIQIQSCFLIFCS